MKAILDIIKPRSLPNCDSLKMSSQLMPNLNLVQIISSCLLQKGIFPNFCFLKNSLNFRAKTIPIGVDTDLKTGNDCQISKPRIGVFFVSIDDWN